MFMSKDRRDGKYIKPTDAMHAIMPYLMEKRIESEVSKTETLDITNLMAWIDKKNENLENNSSDSHQHTDRYRYYARSNELHGIKQKKRGCVTRHTLSFFVST